MVMNKKYLTVYNLNLEKEWVLKNAFDVIETQEINTVWELEFTIPKNDQDMEHCQPYWYIRYGDNGQMYRFTEQVKTNTNESTVTFHCEHVIATLSDDVMFQGPYIKGNNGTYTNQVLSYILEKQTPRNGVTPWKLGTCQPRRQFEYSWENENLLAALFSVPNCFATPYMWTYDTTTYPWTVNLIEINEDADPDFYLMAKKNILRSEESSSNLEICTRLYGLGEGEGVNQLTIKSVNNGIPYVQSSPEIIAEYGIVSRIFVDRRYQYADTLKARMEALLHELETPSLKREFDIVDLYDMSPDDMYKAEVGRICLLKDDNTKVYITKTVKNWSVPGDMKITIATKATDISTSIADLADRQRIEQVYSQGASQVYSFSFFGNATYEKPLNGYVYFPDDLKYLNEVKLKVKLDPFRSYSKSKSAYFDEGTVKSEKDGGTKNFTTNSDGGTKDFETNSDGGTKDFETNSDGGTKDFETNSDGGTKDFETNSDGGTKDLETVEGGKVDTESGEGGAQEGETSVVSGGGRISLSPEITISIKGTEDVDWTNDKTKPYTEITNPDLKMKQNQGTHKHSLNIVGYTNNVTPPESADYKHYHTVTTNYQSDGNYLWTAEANDNDDSKHTHEIYDDTEEDGGHYHIITKGSLHHTHRIDSKSIKVVVNNNEGGGQTGFSHSHNFKIKAHTHKFEMPAHTHKFDTPDHQHKFDIPDHQHKFDIPDHQHSMVIGKHQHDIEPGIFESGNPQNFQIEIDNNTITASGTNVELDITQKLLTNGKIPRGKWIKLTVRPTDAAPNNMAYISVFGNVFAFIQSYTGGNF